MDSAVAAGVTVVVAAGNYNSDACTFSPARYASTIAVGATSNDDEKASFSNYGACIDIFAPGKAIVSVGVGSDTGASTKSGTSMACPHVSGAAALLLASNPTMLPSEVRSQLTRNARANTISALTNAD